MFSGKLFIWKSDNGVLASLTLPTGQPFAENDLSVFDINGEGFPMGTYDEKPFASLAEAITHFKKGGFKLTPCRL